MIKIIRLFIMMDNLIILIKTKTQKDFKYVIFLVNFFTFCKDICFGYSKKYVLLKPFFLVNHNIGFTAVVC